VGLDYEEYLMIDEEFYRPSEVMLLKGDATKAKKELGWSYDVSLEDLIVEMVENDLKYFKELPRSL
jgi:GDPmannose 4,6-dehydratase